MSRADIKTTDPDVILGDEDDFLYIRYMTFNKAGDMEPRHSHQHGHYYALFKGKAKFFVEERQREFSAPALIWIDANEQHEIVALEDDTQGACIHAKANFALKNLLSSMANQNIKRK